ncbi:MAG: DNA-3-methyladenine glycosylase I [Methylobacter sp.]|nr:DNA-3-methyladenine glycosylase I [Methylobacter sp.]MDP2427876.1 DNA-3-methyladenine glycosylase I [Methylobacter sp.]MDP3053862.1 DNA-3-methyladenine glycosylase I [Methylobacter sp.]MDP3363566.1 DNA-3-methyladenine glycosylase I [Methylobacter sp.]MDZ4217601.1 DNA-3-methyladenine glycosylase I [Methylobacter sp.]
MNTLKKCAWALASADMEHYHDHEWGVPVHDDRLLFELLILEGAQAGLSWSTILHKRDGYRTAFDHFDANKIAVYDDCKINALMANPAIVRNQLKISATISNARAFLKIQQEFGCFDAYIWHFVAHKPLHNNWGVAAEIPAATPTSELMGKDLKKRGFKFVGSTICYAYMQATGMVNDHTTDCYRHAEIKTHY